MKLLPRQHVSALVSASFCAIVPGLGSCCIDVAIFNECLYFGTRMMHSIIHPNQIRWNGIQFQDNPTDDTFSRERHRQLSAESLAEVWLIGPNRAKATLSATTQNGVRSAILPLSRRYRADRM